MLAVVLSASCFFVAEAQAQLRIDFDHKFLVHPDRQVWDFSMVRPDSVFHIFYHTIHEATPHASYADTIWHATSQDLRHWDIEGPVLFSGQGFYDEGAIWAPDVFFDPVNNNWKMLYTGNDNNFNQSICLAESPDLHSWTPYPGNPVIEPDPEQYIWSRESTWSDFRDPFVWREDDQWHVLVTAKQNLDGPTGVLYHGVSDDLVQWTDVGIFFANDGDEPWHVLESPQYHLINNYHWLFFGEFNTGGLSCIAASETDKFSMNRRFIFDNGYAPEIDQFGDGPHILSRLSPHPNRLTGGWSYPVRMDTISFNDDGTLEVIKPHPLSRSFDYYGGLATMAQPTYRDNPVQREETPAGTVGNGYFGSAEYFQGPLSGRGSPGSLLGDAARGELKSYPFVVTGDRIELLVGGGQYPETLFVALVDAATEEVLHSETGPGHETMTPRTWDIRPHQGRTCYIHIVDDENGEMGHLNVDEIIEIIGPLSSVDTPDPRRALLNHKAAPNPFNPRTSISFTLEKTSDVQLRIHDLRGRLVYSSHRSQALAGRNSLSWDGQDEHGQRASAGGYLYCLLVDGTPAASGKISLVK